MARAPGPVTHSTAHIPARLLWRPCAPASSSNPREKKSRYQNLASTRRSCAGELEIRKIADISAGPLLFPSAPGRSDRIRKIIYAAGPRGADPARFFCAVFIARSTSAPSHSSLVIWRECTCPLVRRSRYTWGPAFFLATSPLQQQQPPRQAAPSALSAQAGPVSLELTGTLHFAKYAMTSERVVLRREAQPAPIAYTSGVVDNPVRSPRAPRKGVRNEGPLLSGISSPADDPYSCLASSGRGFLGIELRGAPPAPSRGTEGSRVLRPARHPRAAGAGAGQARYPFHCLIRISLE